MDDAKCWCKWGFTKVVKNTFDWISSVVYMFMQSNAYKQLSTVDVPPTDLMLDHH